MRAQAPALLPLNDVPVDVVLVIVCLGVLVPLGLASMALDDDGELVGRLGTRFAAFRRRRAPCPGCGRRLGMGFVLLAAGIALSNAVEAAGASHPSAPLAAAGFVFSLGLILTAIAVDISALRLARRYRRRREDSNGATLGPGADGRPPVDGLS